MIVMVLAHVSDAWTQAGDRERPLYMVTVFVSGLAAPLFLFLAGLTLSMAAARRAMGMGHTGAAWLAFQRGAQVFGLAFLFRLQSQVLGWGAWINFLKVDILNVMGVAMMATALLWRVSESRIVRIGWLAAATIAVAMTTPLVREAGLLALLPDPIEAYLRPVAGRTNFALFPWAGFVLAGGIAGELVDAARSRLQERRLQQGLAIGGLAGIGLGYLASFQPSLYPVANFWTSSPTFFFIRLGICTAMLPIARGVDHFHGFMRAGFPRLFSIDTPGRVTATLGRSSLFVYWVHVEMVYGVLGRPLRRALPLEAALTATLVLCLLLYVLVRWKDRLMTGVTLTGPLRIFAPVLK